MSSERATCRASDLAGNEAEVRGGESFGLAARVRPDGVDFAAPAFSAVGGGVRCLLLYSTLSGLRPTLAARLERELSAHGLAPGLSLAQPSRLWAEQFDDAACRVLARYVEHHASSCAALARGCVLEVLGGGGGAGKVGPEVRTLVLQLDRLTAACCVSLGESLAQFQKLDEYTRRGVGHRSNQRNNNQLQLNIDRLFAQRVSVFPLLQAYSARAGSSAGVLELVVGTVLKATVKAAQETLRGRTVRRPEQQQQLVLDLSFLRKCSGSFLPPSASRPAHDVELFHEQLVATLASRNGGQPGVVGINAIQSEVVAEAIKAISALTIVI